MNEKGVEERVGGDSPREDEEGRRPREDEEGEGARLQHGDGGLVGPVGTIAGVRGKRGDVEFR